MPLECVDRFLRREVVASLAFSVIGTLGSAQELPEKPSEYQVKAVYLYNFAKFVEWPADESAGREDAFTVCILGRDPFGAFLDQTLAGETLHGKRAVTKRIVSGGDTSDCEIVFVSKSERHGLRSILGSLKKKSTLTVSDIEGFSERGGMIQLMLDEDRVRFEVNLTAATRAGLTLSSELLKVARSVRRDSSGMRRSPIVPARLLRDPAAPGAGSRSPARREA